MEFLKIIMPNYRINFEKGIDYKFSSKGKENLKKKLVESSKGYCMYCYTRILVDNKFFGHLEHTVEQDTVPVLMDCHHNISIACPTCNLSYKKIQQTERKITVENFECQRDSCINSPCENFYGVYDSYIKNMIDKKLDKIILKPRGVLQGPNREGKFYYEIEYDLFNQKFVPKKNIKYVNETVKFIESHIKKFNLNDEEKRTKEIKRVLEDIINYKKIPIKDRYNNLVAEIFIENLENYLENSKDKEQDLIKVVKLCKILYTKIFLTNK